MANSSYMQHKLPAPEDAPVNGHAEDNGAPRRPSPSRGAAWSRHSEANAMTCFGFSIAVHGSQAGVHACWAASARQVGPPEAPRKLRRRPSETPLNSHCPGWWRRRHDHAASRRAHADHVVGRRRQCHARRAGGRPPPAACGASFCCAGRNVSQVHCDASLLQAAAVLLSAV